MKKILLLLTILISCSAFSQNRSSDEEKRKVLLEAFKSNQSENVQYDTENDYFIIITKHDCGDEQNEPKEMQERATADCFSQLLTNITSLKKSGFNLFINSGFKGIIFKTNLICMYKTRRYHFKFSFYELNKFPEYMDFDELIDYVVVQNKNSNIIYVRNER